MNTIKYFICPMSKVIVDVVKQLDKKFALLPTRRQIDWNGGYVNNWNTKTFYDYVRLDSNIMLERDHSGPDQGSFPDDGFDSYKEDVKFFDLIHIDPWKKYQDFDSGVKQTIEIIKFLYNLNPKVKYEIATEEVIKKFTTTEINNFLEILKNELSSEMFKNIEYCVIQSGVKIDLVQMKNLGVFNIENLKLMSNEIKKFGIKTKEHNGDYLTNDEYITRFNNGLDSINIGPEIAQIQTLTYLKYMSKKEINIFYDICLNSKKWIKWVPENFDIKNKEKLIQVCGHYCFDLVSLPDINDLVVETLKNKLNSLP